MLFLDFLRKVNMMKDKVLAVAIVYLTCHFVINVILSGLNGSGVGKGLIFQHTIGEVSRNHTIQVTPAGYTFMIWNVIYLWILAVYVYLNVNLFRTSPTSPCARDCRNKLDTSFDFDPPVFGRKVALVLILNCYIYTAWMFFWDNQLMTASAVGLIGIALTNWIALGTFSVSLWKNVTVLKTEAPIDLLLHRVLIQNGLAVYTTWTTLASLINFAVALVFDGNVDDPRPSLIALIVLSILLVLWVPLELIFWDNYFRYMIAPLFVVLWALMGISVKQHRTPDIMDNSVVLATTSLIIATICLIAFRVIITIYRHFKRPLYVGLPTTRSQQNELQL